MKKKTLIAFLSLIFIFVWFLPVYAERPTSPPDVQLPEQAGIYDVPGHPNLKLRVFVYRGRPAPTPTPAPVCGLPDPESEAVPRGTGWHLPQDWTYELNSSSVPASVGGENLVSIASQAFNSWLGAIPGKVNLTLGSETTIARYGYDNKNIIAWGRTQGTALAVTYTWYYPDTGLVAETDTIMNKKFPWSWTPYDANLCAAPNTYDAQDILTHELGHWVGLDDEYEDPYVNNTMYGYGAKAEIKKDTLTTGDVAGAALIYK